MYTKYNLLYKKRGHPLKDVPLKLTQNYNYYFFMINKFNCYSKDNKI